jgi:hypothetical protein
MRLHPRRLLAVAAAVCVASSAAAQSAAPSADPRVPPSRFLVIAPLTAFPDPVAASLAFNGGSRWTGEAGVALLAPGAFVRAGVYLPVRASASGGSDVLAYVGYRGVALPLLEAVHGPTAGIGLRSWPRNGGWGWQVNTGLWFTNQGLDCGGSCAETAMVLPEVRFAAIRAR